MSKWTEKRVYELRDDINCPYDVNDPYGKNNIDNKIVVDVNRITEGWSIQAYKRKDVKVVEVGIEEWIICVGGRGLVETSFSRLTTREAGMILKAFSISNN